MDDERLRLIESRLDEVLAFQRGLVGVFVAWMTGGPKAAIGRAAALAARTEHVGRHG